MTHVADPRCPASPKKKEFSKILKRTILVLASAAILTAVVLPIASASASAPPWWQVLTGSRPTNLWEPEPSEREIETGIGSIFGFEGAAIKLEIGGAVVGCLGTQNFLGEAICNSQTGFAPTETAAQLQTLLEAVLSGSTVEVTGGPVGGEPFLIVTSGAVPAMIVSPMVGTANLKLISPGGSGRLALTFTNLGDVPIDGSTTPIVVTDELPEGVVATGVEAFAGSNDSAGPVNCSVEVNDLVACTYEGTLPPYEAIEVEVLVSLTGEPPVAGAPGKATIEGGNAPPASVPQTINVSPEEAPSGFEHFSVEAEEEGGGSVDRAGTHPFQMTTTIQLNSGKVIPGPTRRQTIVEQPALPRNLRIALPAGLVGNPTAIARCKMKIFFEEAVKNHCPSETALGVASVTVVESLSLGFTRIAVPVFNLVPGPGEPARFGFVVGGAPVLLDIAVHPDDNYRIVAEVRNTTQAAQLLAGTVTIWGSPGDPRHDASRGWSCIIPSNELPPCARPLGLAETAFLRQPVSCITPLIYGAQLEPWNVPFGSEVASAGFDGGTMSGCNQVPFDPTFGSAPTSQQAGTSSGLDFQLDMPNAGFLDPKAKAAEGQAKRVEAILPEGVTVNPSQANGLGACSPADYARERADSPPGQGCPESSKVGSIDIATPLLEEEAHGAVYVAAPYDNPFDSLLALYIVARIPERGVLVKQAGKVELNPNNGRIVTTFDNLPQIPFQSFKLHFFAGDRAPLVMPAACGDYDIVARFTPWNASNPGSPLPSEIVTRSSSFRVDHGPSGGPCPSGTAPFKPGFVAGTESNSAGKYSPFTARLTRNDDEQEFTRFSMKLPKGVIGKLAGIPFCSDAGIAAARARTGVDGGQEELEHPSCPDASQIGRTSVGAGVGPALTYAPGKIYLAGPYQGSKLSIVAITTAKVGPFDLGTVVIRQALKVDPETAEVSTDGSSSDPIPHILQGIVTHARDIRISVDRKDFVLNPTSCERMTVTASVFGSGIDFGSPGDDQSVDVSSPFQAADCASLGFKPKLKLSLKGGTRRTANPKLKAVLEARKGDANIGRAQVTLPRSEFIEQSHFQTVCTRVQFRAGGGNGEQCPSGSKYGRAKALSPLLDEPLTGPVFLRSSEHALPDLVVALHSSKVDINLVGRVDSVNQRLRTTFETVPDAPVTKFVLEMRGGKKGLFVNSVDICKRKQRATADFRGQNGRHRLLEPVVKADCKGKSAKKGGKR